MRGIKMNRHIILSNKLLVAMSGISSWTSRNGQYVYEKNNYHISESYITQKWTKSAIRQFLAYVSLSNNKGHITFASEEELADMIHCSVRTVQENNKMFVENGILEVRRIWGEFLDVNIINYTKEVRDLEMKEDGTAVSTTGYTSIWHEVMTEILAIENINVLRLALRCLLLHEKEVHVQELEEAILSYDEIKGFLPKYVGYKKAIKELASNLSNIFHISCMENKEMVKDLFSRQTKGRTRLLDKLSKPFALSFEVLTSEDSRIIREKERNETMMHWFEFKKRAHDFIPVHEADIQQKDLNTLSDTFGASIINESFELIVNMLRIASTSGHETFRLYESFKAEPLAFIQKRIQSVYMAKTAVI